MTLEKYLATVEKSEAAFARELGVSQVTINRYVRNERYPDPTMIARIEAATGRKVGVQDWYSQARAAKATAA